MIQKMTEQAIKHRLERKLQSTRELPPQNLERPKVQEESFIKSVIKYFKHLDAFELFIYFVANVFLFSILRAIFAASESE